MGAGLKQIIDTVPPARKALAIPSFALRTVMSRGGKSVYASSDTLFKGAIFGRDSLEVAEDLIAIRPKLARNILISLAELQGLAHNHQNEEEPGKIIHEYRTIKINGKLIDPSSFRIFQELSQKWGGNDYELAYYGSVDSTPHFLRTLHMYCEAHGDAILDHVVTQRNEQKTTMRQVAAGAATWLIRKLSTSKSGLIEYKRLNPHGILNQVWKDSEEFYVHENKEFANHDRPIASVEVQAIAYDALMAADVFFPGNVQVYTALATELRDKTIELLWQEDRRYFALGLDYSKQGRMRIIKTETANPAYMLDTRFFDGLPVKEREKYITATVKKIMNKDFLTMAGIRSRSLSAAHLISFWDYHGSYVSWPKETYDIAKGLRRQGLPRLGRQLENRLLNIIFKTHEYLEFVYVDEWGRVLTTRPTKRVHGELVIVEGAHKPERIQAWTVSAIMAIISARVDAKLLRQPTLVQEPWQKQLEERTLSRIPNINRYINPIRLLMRYPTHKYRFTKDKR